MANILGFPIKLLCFDLVLSVSLLSSIVASQSFNPPAATVVPFAPKGLKISIPHEQGIVWVEFHLKINQEFNSGLESGTYNGGIVKPHNGHWTYFDKSIELKTGDLVHYWIHVNHNGVKYNSEKRQFRVTELLSEDQVGPEPGSGPANVASTFDDAKFVPPSGSVIPFSPKGLRISIPHVEGMTWASFHIQINKNFNGLEVGSLTRDIVKPHNGQWFYEDKDTKLKIGDMVYYWVHIIHNDEAYNLVDQQHRVTELNSQEQVAPLPISGTANVENRVGFHNFDVPSATVIPYAPKGFSISIPDEPGIVWVAFHLKLNDKFHGLESGDRKDIARSKNGKWTYEDNKVELKFGDVVYYWVQIVHHPAGGKSVDYNLIDQEYQVAELYSRGESPAAQHGADTMSTSDDNNENCKYSHTKIFDDAGRSLKRTCRDQLLFEENFDDLNETRWMVAEHFPKGPDYEFAVYMKNEGNVNVEFGALRITPQILTKKYKKNFIYHGTLTLRNCTSYSRSRDCVQTAQGSYIIPPVSSGKLTTEKSFKFLYGRVEIRAKFPRGDWIYPKLSLEPFKSNLPVEESASIRVASSVGNPELHSHEGSDLSGHVLRGGVVCQSSEKFGNSYFHDANSNSDSYWYDDFHVYELTWLPNQLQVKVDGRIYGSSDDSRISALNQPVFINLALAVGGHNEFPNDAVSSDNCKKPWSNSGSKALFHFFEAASDWKKTWQDGSTDLIVDYVKVYAV